MDVVDEFVDIEFGLGFIYDEVISCIVFVLFVFVVFEIEIFIFLDFE